MNPVKTQAKEIDCCTTQNLRTEDNVELSEKEEEILDTTSRQKSNRSINLEHPTSKLLRVFRHVDKQVTHNFMIAGIQTRPVNANGLWCCVLIPAILLTYNITHKVSPIYSLIAYLSLGQLIYSFLFIIFIYVSCLVLRDTFSAGCVVSVLFTVVPLYYVVKLDLLTSVTFSSLAIFPYYRMITVALLHCPKTFTVGEAMIVSQGIVLFANIVVADFYYAIMRPELVDPDMSFIKTYVYTMLSTVGLIVTVLSVLDHRKDVITSLYVIFGAAVYALIVAHCFRGIKAIPEFILYIFVNDERRRLFSFWLIMIAIMVFVLAIKCKSDTKDKATTEMRKAFHILGSIVFVSGIVTDVKFMMLAAGMVFGLLIFVESLRVLNVYPVGEILQHAFTVYSDEKDVGVFAMTPIYLYVGLACPFLLVPWREAMNLELMSGVLSIGVGDTAASYLGSRYGNNKWPDGTRTVEGTLFNMASQIVVVYVLQLFDLIQQPHMLLRSAVAALVSAIVESRITQVDNLILPLVTILAFQSTIFLA